MASQEELGEDVSARSMSLHHVVGENSQQTSGKNIEHNKMSGLGGRGTGINSSQHAVGGKLCNTLFQASHRTGAGTLVSALKEWQ